MRIKDISPECLAKWFMDLKVAIKEYKIVSENMYNMDESGFSIDEIQSDKCIINAQIR